MRWTKEQLDEYEARRRAKGAGYRSGAVQEKQQDDNPREAHHKPEVPDVEQVVCPKFRVSVVLHYSDLRRRDIDGGLSTLLDALVTARGRFVDLDS